MIGMIMPLVKAAKDQARWWALAHYSAGALISAFALGTTAMILADLSTNVFSRRSWAALVGIGGAMFIACDLELFGLRPFSLRRQTCRLWWDTVGPERAWFFWGLDLGMGWTTIRVTSLLWMALLFMVLVPPIVGPMLGIAYAVGLTSGLGGAIALAGAYARDTHKPCSLTLRFQRPFRLLASVLVAVTAAVAVASAA